MKIKINKVARWYRRSHSLGSKGADIHVVAGNIGSVTGAAFCQDHLHTIVLQTADDAEDQEIPDLAHQLRKVDLQNTFKGRTAVQQGGLDDLSGDRHQAGHIDENGGTADPWEAHKDNGTDNQVRIAQEVDDTVRLHDAKETAEFHCQAARGVIDEFPQHGIYNAGSHHRQQDHDTVDIFGFQASQGIDHLRRHQRHHNANDQFRDHNGEHGGDRVQEDLILEELFKVIQSDISSVAHGIPVKEGTVQTVQRGIIAEDQQGNKHRQNEEVAL